NLKEVRSPSWWTSERHRRSRKAARFQARSTFPWHRLKNEWANFQKTRTSSSIEAVEDARRALLKRLRRRATKPCRFVGSVIGKRKACRLCRPCRRDFVGWELRIQNLTLVRSD